MFSSQSPTPVLIRTARLYQRQVRTGAQGGTRRTGGAPVTPSEGKEDHCRNRGTLSSFPAAVMNTSDRTLVRWLPLSIWDSQVCAGRSGFGPETFGIKDRCSAC